ncbi:MAG: DUF3784 domain-containing protein [Ruminococcus sp.]|nr:DUF3784 domain-containing protein [Ruminococcus sp.]
MNIGFYMCIILVPVFFTIGLLFGIFKDKATKFVSGFNSLSEKEQNLYDKVAISQDIRNSCFIWTSVMLIGALGSLFLTSYFAIIAYVVWGILFFKDIHFDVHKAFDKYLIK